jgi:hypothetical protein
MKVQEEMKSPPDAFIQNTPSSINSARKAMKSGWLMAST